MIKKNIEIKINSKTRQVFFDDNFLGIQGENLQGYLIFKFEDEFVDGVPVVKVKQNGEKYNVYGVVKENDTYKMIIKSSLMKTNSIYLQLAITENGTEEGIPKFISKDFYMYIGDVIETDKEIPEEYPAWIDIANQKMTEMDNLNIDMQDGVVTITRKDGTQHSENVKGDDYVITEEDYNVIENQVKTDIQPILEEIENVSKQAEIIAKGRATGYVFDTVEELNNWLLVEENVSKLVLGDNLYIRTVGVPDYWWDGTSKQVLETEKPDLTDYAKKEQFVTLKQAEYDELSTNGTYEREDGTILIFSANTYYFIIEEE